jgi:lipopolysaccharide transport system ATP-binding protein
MALVRLSNVTVEFPIYEANARSLRSTVMRAATGGVLAEDAAHHVVVRALDRVSFELHEGDRVGLVGHNGSGKSTLLRVIAGVYEPVSGSVQVNGTLASMLNVWLGMNVDATGLENIYLRASVLGMRRREVDALVSEITAFAGLGDYINMPLRTYSSGMMMRLAFAVSTSVNADIVLMDEWLSAGDASFTHQAEERLHDMLDRTKVLVVASHNEALIRKSCNKIMRLEHGVIADFGPIEPEKQDTPQQVQNQSQEVHG